MELLLPLIIHLYVIEACWIDGLFQSMTLHLNKYLKVYFRMKF